MVDTQAVERQRELAHRASGGIEVTLYWRPFDDLLTLRVSDSRTGDRLEYHPAPEDALASFQHPYALAQYATPAGRRSTVLW